MDWSGKLRAELNTLANDWAKTTGLSHYHSIGASQTVLFEPTVCGTRHGNFADDAWTAIRANPQWAMRLGKSHTQRAALPPHRQQTACELDSSMSSDALLMNCFCFPNAASSIFQGLGIPWQGAGLEFGFNPKIPLAGDAVDATEVDLSIGDLLIEAKLTEKSFTTQAKSVVHNYRDFTCVFDPSYLPQDANTFGGYQLIRNVLAAYNLKASGLVNASFLVLLDARRPDLLQEWWNVHSAIRDPALRARCEVRTWQQVAAATPLPLQIFLKSKYGL